MSKPYDLKLSKEDFNVREKLTVVLVLFLINLLKPWEYSHQQSEFFDEVYSLLGIGKK